MRQQKKKKPLPVQQMTSMNDHTSVIAAVSTPPGKGGVAIIRISGDGALDIADKIFVPRTKKTIREAGPRVQVYGDILYRGEVIDDGLATRFDAPFSYTGEETVEISCHGGILITEKVLESALVEGALLAGAGEFTRRAFINGKLTITEAEAIGNLLEAESVEQIRLASKKSLGKLSEKIEDIRKSLIELMSSIYARIDYPDEDLGDFSDEETAEILKDTIKKMETLAATYKTGKAVNEGIKTVICGKPNVGKSSVYNMLLGRDAAIVTDIKGTTRDVLTDKISLGKVMLSISDTAGIRNTDGIDLVEKIGIERSIESLKDAELVFAVFDSSSELTEEDREIIFAINRTHAAKVALINKTDLGKHNVKDNLSSFNSIIEISAKEAGDKAKDDLKKTVEKLFTDEKIVPGKDAIVFSARQNSNLIRALDLTRSALDSIKAGVGTDAVSSDIERALAEISELDGRAVSEEIVADIFSKFCVGK